MAIEKNVIPILYVFKFDNANLEKAVTRFNCSLECMVKQGDIVYVLNASDFDVKHLLFQSPKINYIHRPHKGYFNKSLLINYMVKTYLKDYKYFIFSDIDLVYEQNYISKIKEHINQNPLRNIRVVPYNVNMAMEYYSNDYKILNDIIVTHSATVKNQQGWAHGNGLIHIPSFMKIKGYNEYYLGYSAEDQSFNSRIAKINKIIFDDKLRDIHIWHEAFNREYSTENKNLFEIEKKEIEKGKLVYNDKVWGSY